MNHERKAVKEIRAGVKDFDFHKPLKTEEDVRRFFKWLLVVKDVSFHPDDQFKDIVSPKGARIFSNKDAPILDERMEEAFKVTDSDPSYEANKGTIYEIATQVWEEVNGKLVKGGRVYGRHKGPKHKKVADKPRHTLTIEFLPEHKHSIVKKIEDLLQVSVKDESMFQVYNEEITISGLTLKEENSIYNAFEKSPDIKEIYSQEEMMGKGGHIKTGVQKAIAQIKPEGHKKKGPYVYIIDIDKPGMFSAHVQDRDGIIVWAFDNKDDYSKDKYMKDKDDIDGLHDLLVDYGVIGKDDIVKRVMGIGGKVPRLVCEDGGPMTVGSVRQYFQGLDTATLPPAAIELIELIKTHPAADTFDTKNETFLDVERMIEKRKPVPAAPVVAIVPDVDEGAVIREQLASLKAGLKYLKGAEKKDIQEQIKSYELALKYLPEKKEMGGEMDRIDSEFNAKDFQQINENTASYRVSDGNETHYFLDLGEANRNFQDAITTFKRMAYNDRKNVVVMLESKDNRGEWNTQNLFDFSMEVA